MEAAAEAPHQCCCKPALGQPMTSGLALQISVHSRALADAQHLLEDKAHRIGLLP